MSITLILIFYPLRLSEDLYLNINEFNNQLQHLTNCNKNNEKAI